MSTANKLTYLNGTKQELKQAINNIGGEVTDETTFREYVNQLENAYDRLPKTEFEEGESITLENTLKGKLDFQDGKVGFGQVKQTTTTGKNKFEPSLYIDTSAITAARCNVDIDDDEFVMTATGQDMYFGEVTAAGTTYSKSKGVKINVEGQTSIYLYLTNTSMYSNYITAFNSENVSLGYRQIASYKGRYDIPEGTSYITLRFGLANATNGQVYRTKVMITFGATEDTNYEKYSGGYVSPSPNWKQGIKGVSSKNIVESKTVHPSIAGYADVLLCEAELQPLTTYAISFEGIENNKLYCNEALFDLHYFTVGSGRTTLITRTRASISKTNTNQYKSGNGGWLIFKNNGSGNPTANVFNNLQIEEGIVATPFIEHNKIKETIRGKNRFDAKTKLPTTQTLNGVTFTNNGDGTFNVSGTASANTQFIVSLTSILTKGHKYGLYSSKAYNNPTFNLTMTYGGNAVKYVIANTGTFEFENKYSYANLVLWIDSGTTISATNVKIMIYEGETQDNNYEPYKTPKEYQLSLGDRKPIEIGDYRDYIGRSTGKNKAQIELEGKYREYRYGTIQTNADFNGYIASVKPNTSYIANGNGLVNYPARLSNLCFFDSEMTYIDGNAYTSADKTFTTPNNCYYVTVAVSNYISNFQIEEGSIATNFEPFGVGVWYEYKNIGSKIFTGANDEGWIAGEYGTNSYYVAIDGAYKSVQDADDVLCIANIFRGVRFFYRTTSGDNIVYLSSGGTMYIRNTSYASLADFKAMLSTNNMIAYYVLDIPEITPITGTLAEQLEEWWNGQSNNGTTIITSNGNLPMIIKVRGLKGE